MVSVDGLIHHDGTPDREEIEASIAEEPAKTMMEAAAP
jgi:hypothetical protein